MANLSLRIAKLVVPFCQLKTKGSKEPKENGLSKLPGDDADKGEGLNRHTPGRKRNRKRKPFADRESKKRSDNDVDTPRYEEFASGKQNRRSFGRANKDSGFGNRGNATSRNAARQPDSSGFGWRDDSPGVRKTPDPSNGFTDTANEGSGGRRNARGGENTSSRRRPDQGRPSAREKNRPSLNGRQNTSENSKARHKNRNRKKGKAQNRFSSDEERLARALRQPHQPVPDVAYQPTTKGQGGKTPEREHGEGMVPSRRMAAEPRRRQKEPYAALDLGTNNCRLLVAVPQERGRFRVIDGFSRIVRLGEGLGQSGRLSDDAMERALDALKICSEKLISHNIRRHRLIATEACRQAANGAQFLERVRAETGMKLEIINRETEAHLAAEGCGALMDRKADAAVLFDIGGGSSELVLVNRRHRKKRISEQIVSWTSLPVGVVTLAERHGGRNVDHKVFASMIEEVKDHISAFEGRDELRRLWRHGRVHLLGTSGTVTTLAGIHLGLPRYERRLVDGVWLNSADIDRVVKELLVMNYEQRAASPCIGQERADLVMAGCAILEAIRQTWPSEKLRVADRGLREGILTQMMERDAAWLPAKNNRWRRNRQQHARKHTGTGRQQNGQER